MVQDIRRYSFDTFRAMSPKYAFKVIEIELGMMYDLLYTKAPLLYTRQGLVQRLRSFVLTCSVMVLFPVLVDNDKQKYSKVDLSITYLLIIVAVIHDIYAALLMVLSDTFAVWLIEHRNDSIIKTLNCFPLLKRQPSNNITRRWSNKMPQYSVPSSKVKPWMSFKLLNKRIEMGKYWHCEVSEDLRKLIFEYVRQQAEDAVSISRWTGRTPFTELPSHRSLGQQVQQLIKSINRINQDLYDIRNVLQLNPGYVVKFSSRSTNSFDMVSLKVDLIVVRIELGGEMPDLDVLLCFLLLCWFSCFCLVCGSPSVFFVVWELLSGLFVESYASAS
ncbi:hypothetical protein LWI29_012559 [Acer saccharum]|uniref:DUF4220 domain-containing protein n=1 Tax=Acer saccharum TaxID=4024 RepID=A0AA39SE11_ACESA|nr:hypothetical protein LWI29_012559 [Acer saccharum]